MSPLIPVIRSSRRRAEAIFNQPGPGHIPDRVVRQVQLWRAIVGLAASLLLVYTYGADDGWSGIANDGVVKLILAPLLLILTGPLVVLGFIRYAPAGQRRLLRSRLRAPLKAVGWYIGIFVGVGLVLAGSAVILKQNYGTLVNGLIALALLIGLVWLLPFLGFSSAYAARYAFNTSNVHAALPAALTVVLVWELMLCSVALEGGMPHGPCGRAVVRGARRPGVRDRGGAVGTAPHAHPPRRPHPQPGMTCRCLGTVAARHDSAPVSQLSRRSGACTAPCRSGSRPAFRRPSRGRNTPDTSSP